MTNERWRSLSCCRRAATAISCEPWRRRSAKPDEADVEGLIGAGRHEPTAPAQLPRRYRDRSLDTRLGQLQSTHPRWPGP